MQVILNAFLEAGNEQKATVIILDTTVSLGITASNQTLRLYFEKREHLENLIDIIQQQLFHHDLETRMELKHELENKYGLVEGGSSHFE